jgi:hypothetical protein
MYTPTTKCELLHLFQVTNSFLIHLDTSCGAGNHSMRPHAHLLTLRNSRPTRLRRLTVRCTTNEFPYLLFGISAEQKRTIGRPSEIFVTCYLSFVIVCTCLDTSIAGARRISRTLFDMCVSGGLLLPKSNGSAKRTFWAYWKAPLDRRITVLVSRREEASNGHCDLE